MTTSFHKFGLAASWVAMAALTACAAEVETPPDDMSDPDVQVEEPLSEADAEEMPPETPDFAAATLEDLTGGWQPVILPEEGYEVLGVRDTTLDYETTQSRQAGWEIGGIEDGIVMLDYTRGPDISAVPFPEGERPIFDVVSGNNLRATVRDDRLQLSSDGGAVELESHPAMMFSLPAGMSWALVETYDDLAETNPEEFGEARLSFNDYSVSVSAGCNGGGTTFVQDEQTFRPGLLIMTQMLCENDGDEIAARLVRSGPAFQREGDRLYRDFPEGREVFEVRANETE